MIGLAEHALKTMHKIEPARKTPPPKALLVMKDNKELIEQIISQGGNVSTVAKELGYAYVTISKYINVVVGKEFVQQAKDNGAMASASAVRS
mgnify:CR=1 FL=1